MTEKNNSSIEEKKSGSCKGADTDMFYDGEIIETKDMFYENTVRLLASVQCLKLSPTKVKIYQKAASQFKALYGYKDSEEKAEECSNLAKQTKKEIKKDIYEKAKKLKSTAKTLQDYQAAAAQFHSISGYRDADDMVLECERKITSIQKKENRRWTVSRLAVLLGIILIIFGATRPRVKYYWANLCKASTAYDSAIKTYKKLGNYRDSKDKIAECQYRKGLAFEAEKSYKNARKAFAAAGSYKDSENRMVRMEKLLIKESKTGDVIKIGNGDWRILEVKDNQAFLMKNEAMDYMAYNSVSGETTWERCTLRQWLNSSFVKESFSESEQKNILLSNIKNDDNPLYGTNGGNDTKDYIFLLSIEEADQYQNLFPAFKSNTWLRSPGSNPGCAAFLSVNGSVMDYGYIAVSEEIKVRPVMWFNMK